MEKSQRICLILFILFLYCTPPYWAFQAEHAFYAGSIDEGLTTCEMYGWKANRIDTIKKPGRTIFIFHYKEADLK